MPYLTVGEAAAELGCAPKLLTDMIYRRIVDTRRCPLSGGRRQIPRELLPHIADVIQRRHLARPAIGERNR